MKQTQEKNILIILIVLPGSLDSHRFNPAIDNVRPRDMIEPFNDNIYIGPNRRDYQRKTKALHVVLGHTSQEETSMEPYAFLPGSFCCPIGL
jgi:hypothetical protein